MDADEGVTAATVEVRRQTFGKNALKGARSVHPIILFLKHLINVMSIILLGAMGLALAVHDYVEAVVIGFIVVANAIVGFLQEHSSEQTMQALRRLSCPLAHVVREGHVSVVGLILMFEHTHTHTHTLKKILPCLSLL